MEFGVLGPLQVRAEGDEVEIRAGLSRTLLVALVLRAPDPVSADALIDLLWREDLPRNPANALQIQVSYLRKVLSAATLGSQPIVTRPGGYALDVEHDAVDYRRFERLVTGVPAPDSAQSAAQAEAALRRLDEALSLWRGEALADVAGEAFALAAATRLEEMRWSAHELRNDLLLALGRHRDVVGEVGSLAADQPLRERFHEQLMIALYRCGRQADALRAYEAARSALVEQLGLDPGPGLQQLEQRVLAQDPALDWLPLDPPVDDGPDPAGSLDWRRSSVPAPTTTLIGRESELARIRDLMARGRLVTLTGPGGAGKTRLAIELATEQSRAGPVWYVDLGAIDLPELVAPTIAAAVGATTGPADDPIDVVASAFAAESGLLVLDTCEHVLAGAARVTSMVLRRAPGLRVLATSRRSLGVAGEVAWPVPPLAVALPEGQLVEEIATSPAVRLFAERAQAVQPDFELTGQNAGDVAAICLALDGLPLAIELAAARTDVLTPAAILGRLQNRFDLLVEGAADAAVRQQTLRGAIDWSVELLSEEQRRFFARLGVFAGGFDLPAAEHVAGAGTGDALELLTGLLRHSMVVRDGPERFRLLDTLRAYAEDLLAELDADETRRRHAEHFVAMAEHSEATIRNTAQRDALALLRAESPNLLAALEWSETVGDLEVAVRLAGALSWFWALDGRLDAADRHLRRAIAIDTVPAALRSKVLWGYSLLVSALGDLDEGLRAGHLSVELAREAGDDVAIGAGLNALAVAQWALGDMDAAAVSHDEAIERFGAAHDIWGEAICRVLRARTALDVGEADGEERLRAGLEAARRCGDAHVIGIALGLLAQLHGRRGALSEGIQAATESLALQESIGYAEGTVSALHLLARLRFDADEDECARELVLRGLRLAWKMQHAAAICEALEDLAQIEHRQDAPARALELLATARAERRRRGLPLRVGDRPAVDKLVGQLDPALASEVGDGPDLAHVVSNLLR
ncbi:MAG TPA: BTAD domain-containing putative transcriptional regulator [Acidimicrobiales bacterium]|nr:BTAD domain-containing putative transcriptional regulator [Acidimicrobiales bacterium]